ncbi:MAG: pirin family protein [Bacteroidetes bacterium]|nr:pirin family protein [Bacteroidota bacterium]
MIHKAKDRGKADYGWLKANYSFSFGNYYNAEKVRFGLLRVLNDDEVAPGGGFGTHPHDNMEIITIPLEGSLEHKDSMGNGSVIKAGEIQVMSAGTGLSHSEFNPSKEEKLKLLQIWIFPKEKDIEPRYGQMKYDLELQKNHFVNVISPDQQEGKLSIHQDAWFYLGSFDKGANAAISKNKEGNGLFLLVIEGKLSINGETLDKRDAMAVSDLSSINIEALEPSKVLVIEVPMSV